MSVRDDVLAGVVLSDVIGEHVPLQSKGHEYQACCPFHEEKTPSFTVNDQKGFYHCFGCGAHGNAIDFVMAYKGVEYPEALRMLAVKAGVPLGRLRRERRKDPLDNAQIWARLINACQYFRAHAQTQPFFMPPELDFPEAILRKYRIGLFPGSLADERFWRTVMGRHYDPRLVKRLDMSSNSDTATAVLPVQEPGGRIAGVYAVTHGARWRGRTHRPQPLMSDEAAQAKPMARRGAIVLTDDSLTWLQMAAERQPVAALPWPACKGDVSPAVRGLLRSWREVVLALSHGTAYLYDHPLLLAVLNEHRAGARVRIVQHAVGEMPDRERAKPLDEFLIERSLSDAAAHLPGGEVRLRRIAQSWWRRLPEGVFKFAVGERLREAPYNYRPPAGAIVRLSQITHPLALGEPEQYLLRIAQAWPTAVPAVPKDWPAADLIDRLRTGRNILGPEGARLQAHERHCPLPRGVRDAASAKAWIEAHFPVLIETSGRRPAAQASARALSVGPAY